VIDVKTNLGSVFVYLFWPEIKGVTKGVPIEEMI